MHMEYLHYKIPTLTYFYAPVMAASERRWNNDFIIGEWFFKITVTGDADTVVRSDQFSFYGDKFLELLLTNDKDFTEHLFALGKKITDTADFLSELNYQNLKHGKTVTLEDFYERYKEVMSEGIGFGYSLDYSLDKYIKAKNIIVDTSHRYISFIKREQIGLAKIAKLNEQEKQEALAGHALTYSWLLNNYTGEHRATIDYFEKRLQETTQDVEYQESEPEKPQSIEGWVEFLTHIRDERKRMNLIAIGLMDRCIPQLCSEFKIDREQVLMHSVEEIRNDRVQNRKERCMKASHAGIIDVSEEVWNEELAKIKAKEDLKEVSGSVANKGNATGRVTIVISSADFSKVQKGDVVVASMTRPEFAPIFPLCAAIVTNEGGVTCHAAIISRELKIPCVIGTRIATQVFKDGDVVEVDADKGVVRKL